MSAPGLLIAATRSGSGKTVLTLGLMRALGRRGLRVAGRKNGPDYIDPAFHAAVTGRPSYNLDSWSMPKALLRRLASAEDADIVLCEGSMGLFDGVPAGEGAGGSSADVAALTGWPVVMVHDCSGQSQSAAAMLAGCAAYDPRIRIGGVILNRIASERHRRLVADALERVGLPVLGSVPRTDRLMLPERHLGLVQAGETGDLEARVEAAADVVTEHIDLDALLQVAGVSPPLLAGEGGPAEPGRMRGSSPSPPAAGNVVEHAASSPHPTSLRDDTLSREATGCTDSDSRNAGRLPSPLWRGVSRAPIPACRDGIPGEGREERSGCLPPGLPRFAEGPSRPSPPAPLHKGEGSPCSPPPRGVNTVGREERGDDRPPLRPPGQRIAVARDAAFSFLYPHVVDGWRAAGAELHVFSPLADEAPPPGCDACWLPGGYPELHAGRIAAAACFLDGLRAFALDRPVHGECGGYMVLGQGLVDAEGTRHAMAGLLGVETSYAKRRLHLGYRDAVILQDSALGRAGTRLRGHEFHYASVLDLGGDDSFAEAMDAYGAPPAPTGSRRGSVTGTFFHAIAERHMS